MSRAAIYDAIVADTRLIALGLHGKPNPTVIPDYTGDERPSDELFMTLMYGDEVVGLRSGDGFVRRFRPLTIWVHCHKDFSEDYARVDEVLDIVESILLGLVHAEGGDGYTLTVAEPDTRSKDMTDRVYQTICRSATYKILSRKTESV